MTDAGDPGSSGPVLRRRTMREPVAPEEALDEATVISTRRAAPVDEATRLSGRRSRPIQYEPVEHEPVGDEQIDDRTRLSARGGRPFDDATALSVRRGGPGGASAVGPRRSPPRDADGVTESATTSPAESEVEDTILRPLRPATPSPEAAEPAFEAALPHRAAYVPTADDLADRRAPRAPEVAVAPRAQTFPPRSLDRGGDAGSAASPQRARRLRPHARLLILAVAVGVVAILSAVALALLLG